MTAEFDALRGGGFPVNWFRERAGMPEASNITVAIVLWLGPLDRLRVQVTVATLADLPGSFVYLDGEYRPWLTDDAVWMHTPDGAPHYIWQPNK